MRTLIKICGLRRLEDAQLACSLGATLLGCVVAPDSPRSASAQEICALTGIPALRERMALVFRGVDLAHIKALCREMALRRVQVHGATESGCRELEESGLIVHRVHAVSALARRLPEIAPAPTPERPAVLDVGRGGGGETFDWSLLEGGAPHATFIAGGITPQNVSALLPYRPWGLDVSSGVESAPGRKDPVALKQLFAVLEGDA